MKLGKMVCLRFSAVGDRWDLNTYPASFISPPCMASLCALDSSCRLYPPWWPFSSNNSNTQILNSEVLSLAYLKITWTLSTFSLITGGDVVPVGQNLAISSKFSLDPAILILGIYPKYTLAKVQKDVCARIFFAALLVKAKIGNSSNVITMGLVG